MNDFQTLDQVHERLTELALEVEPLAQNIHDDICSLLDDIQRAAEVEPNNHETWEGVAGDVGEDWDNMSEDDRERMKSDYRYGYDQRNVVDDDCSEATRYGYEASRWKIPMPRFDSYEDAERSDD